MKNLDAIIKEQYEFIQQVSFTKVLLDLYNDDKKLFLKLFPKKLEKLLCSTPKIQKSIHIDPEMLWEYCEMISSFYLGRFEEIHIINEKIVYPILQDSKNKKYRFLDYTTDKSKKHTYQPNGICGPLELLTDPKGKKW